MSAGEPEARRRYELRRESHVPFLPVWEDLTETERAGAIAEVEAPERAQSRTEEGSADAASER